MLFIFQRAELFLDANLSNCQVSCTVSGHVRSFQGDDIMLSLSNVRVKSSSGNHFKLNGIFAGLFSYLSGEPQTVEMLGTQQIYEI